MKIIEEALSGVDGYLISISRDTVNGWYVLEIGLPAGWVFDENEKIGCEVLIEEEEGTLIKISPKIDGIVIDDLIGFLEVIIDINQKISEKEKQFTDKMDEMKRELEEKARNYYKELDDLKDESFKKVGGEFADNLKPKPKSKRGRPKGSKNTKKVEPIQTTSNPTEARTNTEPVVSTVTEDTETLSSKE
jgi:hypothetical protein